MKCIKSITNRKIDLIILAGVQRVWNYDKKKIIHNFLYMAILHSSNLRFKGLFELRGEGGEVKGS